MPVKVVKSRELVLFLSKAFCCHHSFCRKVHGTSQDCCSLRSPFILKSMTVLEKGIRDEMRTKRIVKSNLEGKPPANAFSHRKVGHKLLEEFRRRKGLSAGSFLLYTRDTKCDMTLTRPFKTS